MKSKYIIIFLCFLYGLPCFATGSKKVFAEFVNPVFIETGSYVGSGIQMALDAGYNKVISIELSDKYHNICKKRYAKNSKVTLLKGGSAEQLSKVLPNVKNEATFWLDAHFSGGDTAKQKGLCPIIAELDAIKNHHINTHTILIDDVRLFGTEEFEFITLDEVIHKLLEINPNYTIGFRDGHVKDDILFATIR